MGMGIWLGRGAGRLVPVGAKLIPRTDDFLFDSIGREAPAGFSLNPEDPAPKLDFRVGHLIQSVHSFDDALNAEGADDPLEFSRPDRCLSFGRRG